MVQKRGTGAPSEIIHIHLNTPGGNLSTGVQLVNAMKTSEAHIVCSLESEAHSLGTLIFLAADEFLVHDNCVMMFHNYSGGTWGKGNEQIAALDGTTKWFNGLVRKIYIPFLSEEELERILRGEDLWLQTEEIRERFVDMVKILEKKAEDEAKAEAAPKKKATRKKKTNGK